MVKIIVSLLALCCTVLLAWCLTRERVVKVQLVLPDVTTGESALATAEARHREAVDELEVVNRKLAAVEKRR